MTHGIDALEWLRSLPVAVVLGAAIVTRLGDTWFVLALVVAIYLLADRFPLRGVGIDRPRGAVVLGITIAAIAAVIGLKAAIGHPRPPGAAVPPAIGAPRWMEPVVAALTTADGYSLPSGHALQSTAVYGGLALAHAGGRRVRRLVAAGSLVGLIAISRVVLGVHYLLDVVAGVVAGAALLAAVWMLAADRPGLALGIALAVALGAVLVAGFAFEPLAVLGSALGARLAWGAVGGMVPDRPADRREARRLAWLGGPIVLVLGAIVLVGTIRPGETALVVVGFVGGVLLAGAVVALPAAVGSRPRGPKGA